MRMPISHACSRTSDDIRQSRPVARDSLQLSLAGSRPRSRRRALQREDLARGPRWVYAVDVNQRRIGAW